MELSSMEGIWAAAASVAAIGTSVWAFILKNKTAISETKVKVAEDARDREIADSAHTLYQMMNERIKLVEGEVIELRKHNKRLEAHIGLLERIMREHNITVPVLDL